MSLRTRTILIGAGMAVVTLLWLLLVFRPSQHRVSDLRGQQATTRTERAQLLVRLAHLQALQRDEPRLRAELARLTDALPDDPRLPDFILQIQEAANLAGIPFISITPALPAAFAPPGAPAGAGSAALRSIAVTVATQGDYFELEDFVVRLERLRRAVRVNSFSLAPGGDATVTAGTVPAAGVSPTIAVTFQLQMFVNGAAAAPAAPAPVASPAPGATPAPGTTPAPSPTPSPG